MDKSLEKQLKKRLEKEKKRLTKDLSFFAKKDPKVKDNWRTLFPFFGINRSHKDESADKVEEYENLLSIEHDLELRLRNVNKALEKIQKGIYGKCEECKKEIEEERLKIVPEAKTCLTCAKNKK